MSAGEADKSWTQRTKEYLQLLVPAGAVYHEFVSNAGQDVGIVTGPDGQAVLKIDGPHSAPTQHVSEYSTTMICGAGTLLWHLWCRCVWVCVLVGYCGAGTCGCEWVIVLLICGAGTCGCGGVGYCVAFSVICMCMSD